MNTWKRKVPKDYIFFFGAILKKLGSIELTLKDLEDVKLDAVIYKVHDPIKDTVTFSYREKKK